MVAEAAGGFFNPDQLRAVALVSEAESALLKITEDGTIGFMVEESRCDEVRLQLQESGLILKHYRSEQVPFARSCLGEMCPHQEQDAIGHSLEISSIFQQQFPNGAPYLRIGINGCAQNCLASGTDDIHIVGEGTGYKIQIGGKASEIPQLGQFLCENIESQSLGLVLCNIIETFVSERLEGETLYEFVDRSGLSIFEGALPSSSLHQDTLDNQAPSEDLGSSETLADIGTLDDDIAEAGLDSWSASEDDLAGDQPPAEADTILEDSDLDLGGIDLENLEVGLNQTEPEHSESDTILESQVEPVLEPGDLEDHTLELGSLDASALADITLNNVDLGDLEGLDRANHEAADQMMEEEDNLDTEEATDEDVSRVTQAMRSEAAFDKSCESGFESTGTANSLSMAANNPVSEAEDENIAPSDKSIDDIPVSFLRLQEQAEHQSALQVRIIEEILSIVTPNGIKLNLPLSNLDPNTRVVLSLGGIKLECSIVADSVHIRFGATSLSLPVSMLSQGIDEAA
jgi:hypothetical protein